MILLQEFIDFIREEDLFHKKDELLLAVSGGVDSVVLCELCKQAGFNFIIAHCNFLLREEESERDEIFVRSLGERYGVNVLIRKFDTKKFGEENKLSIQVAARELRYKWFREIIDQGFNQKGPKYIVTAHHANDNIETVLMNFFKGTGILGIRGIVPKQGRLVRPLLFAKKAALIDFANHNKLDYVEDSSNFADKYTRNDFRNQLMPAVQKVFPDVQENLIKNIQRFREIEYLYLQAIHQHKNKLLELKGNEIHIPALKLKKTVPLKTVLYEIIREYGFTANQTGEVIDLIDSESGKYIQSASFRVIKNRNWLIISPNKTRDSRLIVINEENHKIEFETGFLEFKEMQAANSQLSTSASIAQLDAGELRFPLLLRKIKQGDYFYPLGMQKKKKLNRFLSDLKLSLTEKENTWVLEMNKKIIWVIGKRIDNRFRLTGKTERVLQVSFILDDGKKHQTTPA